MNRSKAVVIVVSVLLIALTSMSAFAQKGGGRAKGKGHGKMKMNANFGGKKNFGGGHNFGMGHQFGNGQHHFKKQFGNGQHHFNKQFGGGQPHFKTRLGGGQHHFNKNFGNGQHHFANKAKVVAHKNFYFHGGPKNVHANHVRHGVRVPTFHNHANFHIHRQHIFWQRYVRAQHHFAVRSNLYLVSFHQFPYDVCWHNGKYWVSYEGYWVPYSYLIQHHPGAWDWHQAHYRFHNHAVFKKQWKPGKKVRLVYTK